MEKNKKDPELKEKIKTIFEQMSYTELYNFDIWITITIISVVLLFSMYFYIINTIKSVRANWNNVKCNPIYMPFVSIINPEEAANDYNFAFSNFKKCLDNINTDVVIDVKEPINKSFDFLSSIFASASSTISNIADFITYLFGLLEELLMIIIERLNIIIVENQVVFLRITNFINSILGMITNIYYTVILLVENLKLIWYVAALAFFGLAVIPSILAFVLALIIMIIFFILGAIFSALTWIPFIGGIFAGLASAMFSLAATFTIVMIIALVFMIIILIFYISFKNFAQTVIELTRPIQTDN